MDNMDPAPQPQIAAGKREACRKRGERHLRAHGDLAGEAAHSMPPHLAQGAGQGLQDAACLLRCLGMRDDINACFSDYARTRAGEVARIVRKADISGRIMGLSGPAAHFRDIALNLGGPRLMRSWLAEVWAADPSLA